MRFPASACIAVFVLNFVWSHVEGADWVIAKHAVPAPQGASDELRAAIEAAPQPDAAGQPASPQSAEDWKAMAAPINQKLALSNATAAEQFHVTITAEQIAGVNVFLLRPENIRPKNHLRLFLNVHGGAYVFGSGGAALGEAILLARRLEIVVLSIDYRMPPDYPFPAAVDDVVLVYKSVISEYSPSRIIFGGTSAGGGLALASVLRFEELKLPVPGAVYAGTAWADLSKTGDTLYTNQGLDRVLVSYEGVLEQAALLYAGNHELTNPLISPVYANFSGFPPTILVTGTRDLFLSDNVRTHRKLRAADVDAELHVFEGMSHSEYTILPETPESKAVYRELSIFMDKHLE